MQLCCLLVWLLAYVLQVRWNHLLIRDVCVGKCCSVLTQPEWSCQLSRCDSVGTGHGSSAIYHCRRLLLSGNKGVRGKLRCCGKALQPAELPEDISRRSGSCLSGWNHNAEGFVSVSRWPCWTLEQHEGLTRSSQMST